MKRFSEYIKEHKMKAVLIILGVLIAILGVPVIINCLYKLKVKNDFFVAEWEAADALIYYGAVLTFLSTTILSVLALWQNHIINETNNKHTALLERMEREKNEPYLIIQDVIPLGNACNLTLTLKNISENIAQNIHISGFAIEYKNGKVFWNDEKKQYTLDYLAANMKYKFDLENPEIPEKECRVVFQISYRDKFGEEHKCEVKGCFNNNTSVPYFEVFKIH